MCIFNKKRVNSTSEVKNMDKISVVVPCYNEEEALPVYYKEMCRVMDEMKDVVFELIFVDDGSSDATLGIMKDLNEKDSRCRYLSFSRNFGKEAAIYAGLKASEGDYVALMDVDLQDPPTLLPEMYEILHCLCRTGRSHSNGECPDSGNGERRNIQPPGNQRSSKPQCYTTSILP